MHFVWYMIADHNEQTGFGIKEYNKRLYTVKSINQPTGQ